MQYEQCCGFVRGCGLWILSTASNSSGGVLPRSHFSFVPSGTKAAVEMTRARTIYDIVAATVWLIKSEHDKFKFIMDLSDTTNTLFYMHIALIITIYSTEQARVSKKVIALFYTRD